MSPEESVQIEKNSSAVEGMSKTLDGLLDGLHSSEEEKLKGDQKGTIFEKLSNQLDDLLNKKTSPFTKLKESLSGDLDELLGTGNSAGSIGSNSVSSISGSKSSSKKTTKNKPTVQDILKLDENFGLPALILYWKLDDIYNAIIKNPKKENKVEKVSPFDKLGNGIAGLFKNLLGGAGALGGLAVALIAFAGAAVIFGSVQWGSAILGMTLFAGFVTSSILISKLLSKEKENIKALSESAILLSAGFALFSFTLAIVSKLDIQLIKSLKVLGLFAGFIAFSAVIANIVNKEKNSFRELGVGLLYLEGSLLVFSAITLILSNISIDIKRTLEIFALYAGFVVLNVGLAKLTASFKKELSGFTASMALILISFSMFTVISLESAKIFKYITPMIAVFGIFTLFILAMTGISFIISKNIGNFLKFTIGVLLISGGLFIFGKTLQFLSSDIYPHIIPALVTVGLMTGLFVGIGFIALLTQAMLVPLAAFSLSVVLLSVGFLAFSKAIQVISKISTNDMKQAAQTILDTKYILSSLIKLTPMLLLLPIAATFMTVGFVLLLPALIALKGAVAILTSGLFNKKQLDTAADNIIPIARLAKVIGENAGTFGMGMLGSLALFVMSSSLLLSFTELALIIPLMKIISKNYTEESLTGKNGVLNPIKSIAKFLSDNIITFGKGIVGGIALVAFATPALLGFMEMAEVVKLLRGIKIKPEEVDQNGRKGTLTTTAEMLVSIITTISKTAKVNFKDIIKMNEFKSVAKSFSSSMDSIMAVVTAARKIGKDMINPAAVQEINDGITCLGDVVQMMALSANEIKVKSKNAAEAMAIALGAVTNTIKVVSDIVFQIVSLSSTTGGKSKIIEATQILKYDIGEKFIGFTANTITSGETSDGGPSGFTLMGFLKAVGKLKINKNAPEALNAVTDTVKKTVDSIAIIGNIVKNNINVDNAILKLKDVIRFLGDKDSGLINFSIELDKRLGGDSGLLGWAKSGVVGSRADNIKKASEALTASINELQSIIPSISSLGSSNINKSTAEKLSILSDDIIPRMTTFSIAITKLSKDMKDVDIESLKKLNDINLSIGISSANLETIDILSKNLNQIGNAKDGIDSVTVSINNLGKSIDSLGKNSAIFDSLAKLNGGSKGGNITISTAPEADSNVTRVVPAIETLSKKVDAIISILGKGAPMKISNLVESREDENAPKPNASVSTSL